MVFFFSVVVCFPSYVPDWELSAGESSNSKMPIDTEEKKFQEKPTLST